MSLNITLPSILNFLSVEIGIPIEFLLNFMQDSGSQIKEVQQEKSNPIGSPEKRNILGLIVLIVIVGGFFLSNSIKSKITEDKIPIEVIDRYILIQGKAVESSFLAEFWHYAHTRRIYKVEEFTEKDKAFLKTTLWGIIISLREEYSKIEGMSKVVRKVGNHFDHPRFCTHFDNFMKLHSKGDLDNFAIEMVEDMRRVRRVLTKEVLD